MLERENSISLLFHDPKGEGVEIMTEQCMPIGTPSSSTDSAYYLCMQIEEMPKFVELLMNPQKVGNLQKMCLLCID